LDNKPAELLQASPKGTVPVLVLQGGGVIEQSVDIMLWALQKLTHRLGCRGPQPPGRMR
jgi:glutathione S-transferase